MTYSVPSAPQSTMISQDKMEKIIDAVIDGKYSYACLIMLEETGHNPAHYIPYRTYNRLQKQHRASYQSSAKATDKIASLREKVAAQAITDIDYVEPLQSQEKALNGGYGAHRRQHCEYAGRIRKVPFWQAGFYLCGYSS